MPLASPIDCLLLHLCPLKLLYLFQILHLLLSGMLLTLGAEGFISFKTVFLELWYLSLVDTNFNKLILCLSKHSPWAVEQPSNDQPFPLALCQLHHLLSFLWV